MLSRQSPQTIVSSLIADSTKMFVNDANVDRVESAQLLHLIYPLHCRIATVLEDNIRGELTPVQACILWRFRPHMAVNGRQPSLSRKEIAQWVKRWFGITSAAISYAIHGMSNPPLVVVRLMKDPSSAREKLVCLTRKGGQFLMSMEKRGQFYLEQVGRELSNKQLREGVDFVDAFSMAVEKINARGEADTNASTNSSKSLSCRYNHLRDGHFITAAVEEDRAIPRRRRTQLQKGARQ